MINSYKSGKLWLDTHIHAMYTLHTYMTTNIHTCFITCTYILIASLSRRLSLPLSISLSLSLCLLYYLPGRSKHAINMSFQSDLALRQRAAWPGMAWTRAGQTSCENKNTSRDINMHVKPCPSPCVRPPLCGPPSISCVRPPLIRPPGCTAFRPRQRSRWRLSTFCTDIQIHAESPWQRPSSPETGDWN